MLMNAPWRIFCEVSFIGGTQICLIYAHLNKFVPSKLQILCAVEIKAYQVVLFQEDWFQINSLVEIICIFKAVYQLDSTVLWFHSRMIQRLPHRIVSNTWCRFWVCSIIPSLSISHACIHYSCGMNPMCSYQSDTQTSIYQLGCYIGN